MTLGNGNRVAVANIINPASSEFMAVVKSL